MKELTGEQIMIKKYFSSDKMEKSPISNTRAILLVLNYFVGFLFVYPLLGSYISVQLVPNTTEILFGVRAFIYLFMVAVSVWLGWPILKESFQNQPQFKRLMVSVTINLVILYFISAIGSTLAAWLSGNIDSANQMQVNQTFINEPLFTTFITLIYAPIAEEMVFRGAIFRHLRASFPFIVSALLSGLMFGMIHVFDSILIGNFGDLWYLLVYALMGVLFCKVYEDNNSITGSILIHAFNNGMAVMAMILQMLLV